MMIILATTMVVVNGFTTPNPIAASASATRNPPYPTTTTSLDIFGRKNGADCIRRVARAKISDLMRILERIASACQDSGFGTQIDTVSAKLNKQNITNNSIVFAAAKSLANKTQQHVSCINKTCCNIACYKTCDMFRVAVVMLHMTSCI